MKKSDHSLFPLWVFFVLLLIVSFLPKGNFSPTNDAIVDYKAYCDSVVVISGELKLENVQYRYNGQDLPYDDLFTDLSGAVQILSNCQSMLLTDNFSLQLVTDTSNGQKWLSVVYLVGKGQEPGAAIVITDQNILLDMSGLTRNQMKDVLESLFEQLMLLMEEPSLMEAPTEPEPEKETLI